MNAPRRVVPDAPSRRGWCPSLARPMPTGDGLLARVHPPLGRLTPAQARAVADGARRFGNGHVDVTARANLQIRGVGEATRCGLADALATVGLGDVRADGGPQRLTLTTPFAGLEVDAIPALADAVEATGLAIPGLPPKTLVAVESAGRGLALGAAEADLHLVAGPDGLALHLAGDPSWWGVPGADPRPAVAAALRLLAASGQRRMRDVSADVRTGGLESLGLRRVPAPVGIRTLHPGLLTLGGNSQAGHGRVTLLVDAPFGRCTAEALGTLADTAEALGGDGLRLSPSRGFVLAGPDREAAEIARDTLARAGFLTRADDPRGAVAACPGAPACASGSTPTLADAARLAEAFRPFAARGLRAHVSGCAKGCAHPGTADLTLVGRDGHYDVIPHGRPDGLPATRLPFEAALDRVRSADSASSLVRIFSETPPGPRPS